MTCSVSKHHSPCTTLSAGLLEQDLDSYCILWKLLGQVKPPLSAQGHLQLNFGFFYIPALLSDYT